MELTIFFGILSGLIVKFISIYKEYKDNKTKPTSIETPEVVIDTTPKESKINEIEKIEITEVVDEPKTVINPPIVKQDIIPQLVLTRNEFTNKSTIGNLEIDGELFCYVLEDKDRKLESGGIKVYGETAIPRGTYQIIINWSNRFKRLMPLLLNVPQFEGIRIHNGDKKTTSENTHGCLLPAYEKGQDIVLKSKEATNALYKILEEKLKKEKVYIKIQ